MFFSDVTPREPKGLNVSLRKLIPLFCLLILSPPLFPKDFNSTGTPAELAAKIADSMSDEEALAQTFMFGWNGTSPSPLIMQWIRERHIGGVKVFGWNAQNIENLARSIGEMQRAAIESSLHGIPLLAATDQEGGMVRHIKDRTSDTPGNMALGASAIPEDAYKTGLYLGRELAALGINMNFAPVVDLATTKDSVLLGTRSFGEDPVQVGILGTAFMKGLSEAGLIATAKHFPGHGGTNLDSHGILPHIGADEKTLWERELVPYRMMNRSGLDAVMSGHLAFPNTPAGNVPASLSPWFLQSLLRGKLGFKGMVITDDLLMYGAVIAAGSLTNAARRALLAGNDMILVSDTQILDGEFWNSLLSGMKSDPVFRARVREAAERVVAVKLARLRGEKAVPLIPDISKIRDSVPDPEGLVFFRDMAVRGVTIVKKGTIPIRPADRVLLAGRYWHFFQTGRRAYPNAMIYNLQEENLAVLTGLTGGVDAVIFCVETMEDLRLMEMLRRFNKRTVVLSVSSARLFAANSWPDTIVELYSASEQSFIAGFSLLLGRIFGRSP